MRYPLALLMSLALSSSRAGNPDSEFPLSPEVHSDRSVTFRLLAPGAKKVTVRSGAVGKENALTPSEEKPDLWELHTPPAEPGLYDYAFVVDGVYTLDPHNRAFKKWRRTANQLLVPGDPPLLHEEQDVPRGVLHSHSYRSKLLGTDRELLVYTPPGYERGGALLPVLFLLHGSGDDARAWTEVGRAHTILDNLIAQGLAKPMVVVMPYGHGSPPGVRLRELEREDWYRENNTAVEKTFFGEVLPLVAERYRISDKPDKRAIAGLSMGGGQALQFGLLHPEQFAWVCGFSSGVPAKAEQIVERYPELDPEAERRLVWIACGKKDFLLDRNHAFRRHLEERGLEHEWKLTEGGHSWPVWRGYLTEVLPRLFAD